MSEKHVKKPIIRFDGGYKEIMDDVVREFVLNLLINHQEFKQMICTPDHFQELAVGFLVSEGLITEYAEIVSIDIQESLLSIQLNKEQASKLYSKNDFDCDEKMIITTCEEMKLTWCLRHMETLERRSTLFHMTGGVHSAALVQKKNFLMMYEDIGRHNAVDKVIGATFIQGLSTEDKALVLSGRVSSEIVMKATKAKVPIIISKAAPTDLAIELAEQLNIAVIGFVREGRANIYSGKERIW